MRIRTHIQGIPCIAKLRHYQAPRPMQITGTGFGDAIAPDPEEIEFVILDRRGYTASWLAEKMTDAAERRIERELKEAMKNADMDE